MRTTTLYRPVGPTELELIEKSGFHAFPPRLPEQPIFYPVLDVKYAAQIARSWNAPAYGAGSRRPPAHARCDTCPRWCRPSSAPRPSFEPAVPARGQAASNARTHRPAAAPPSLPAPAASRRPAAPRRALAQSTTARWSSSRAWPRPGAAPDPIDRSRLAR